LAAWAESVWNDDAAMSVAPEKKVDKFKTCFIETVIFHSQYQFQLGFIQMHIHKLIIKDSKEFR
jgi:hypothetical protein